MQFNVKKKTPPLLDRTEVKGEEELSLLLLLCHRPSSSLSPPLSSLHLSVWIISQAANDCQAVRCDDYLTMWDNELTVGCWRTEPLVCSSLWFLWMRLIEKQSHQHSFSTVKKITECQWLILVISIVFIFCTLITTCRCIWLDSAVPRARIQPRDAHIPRPVFFPKRFGKCVRLGV